MFSKIKITLIASMLFIAGGMFVSNAIEAQTVINPLCPNGCAGLGDGCFCYEYYEGLKEYDWGDKDSEIN